MPTSVSSSRSKSTFQSAPGQLAGRCGLVLVVTTPLASFNPRPANWPGDAHISARAHRPVRGFQSAPGQLAGRCQTMGLEGCEGEQFQSAPGQLAGRCLSRRTEAGGWMRFNPRPANWPGDAIPARTLQDSSQVSIRARPIGRAMRPFPMSILKLFRVSIRARPIGRAMRGINAWSRRASEVSIRARPIGRAMPHMFHIRISTLRFQSAPGQLAGRCHDKQLCFIQRSIVSIRARPIGRAMRR